MILMRILVMCAHMINQLCRTYHHSHDNINNYNDDKAVYVENEVEFDNDTENML